MELIPLFSSTYNQSFTFWCLALKIEFDATQYLNGPEPYNADHWADHGSFRESACRHGF